jgi:glycosyltransferase involved in cell wall biosynthesis
MNTVSVIVPVYNQEKYLDMCLQSVINQTYKDLEIIIIDDGSTDKSSEIIDKWCLMDTRIFKKRISNRGVATARNIGIDMSTGYYIVFIDADDYMESSMIKRLIESSKNGFYDMVICGVQDFYDNLTKGKIHCADIEKSGELSFEEYVNVVAKLNIDYFVGGPYCKLFKAVSLKSWNVRFEDGQSIGEDFIFNMGFLKNKPTIYYINDPLYNYRIGNPNSLSKVKHPAELYVMRYKEIFDKFIEVLEIGSSFELLENAKQKLYAYIIGKSVRNVVLNSKTDREKCAELENVRSLLKQYNCDLENYRLNIKEKIVITLLFNKRYRSLIAVIKMSAFKTKCKRKFIGGMKIE